MDGKPVEGFVQFFDGKWSVRERLNWSDKKRTDERERVMPFIVEKFKLKIIIAKI